MSERNPPEVPPPPPPMEDYPEELASRDVAGKNTPVRFAEDVGSPLSSVKKTGSGFKTAGSRRR